MTDFKWRHFAGAVKGFEVMRMFRKGQFACWYPGEGVRGEVRFINRQFGIYGA